MHDLNSISKAERISILMDGELSAKECVHVLGDMEADAHAIDTWHVYQVVGDVLRSPELAPKQDGIAFWEKLELRLALEPQRPLVVPNADRPSALNGIPSIQSDHEKPVANAPVFRWKLLAGVACSALVAVVGGGLWNQADFDRGGAVAKVKPVLPDVTVVVAAESPVGPMLRDPHLDELMAAHRQLGGHSALQVPAGFLRNATYEGVGK
jgi:sigma-E factor negative regulatory protein RseA